jgi:hypothetical protein
MFRNWQMRQRHVWLHGGHMMDESFLVLGAGQSVSAKERQPGACF